MAQITGGDPVRMAEIQKISVKEWLILLEQYIQGLKPRNRNGSTDYGI